LQLALAPRLIQSIWKTIWDSQNACLSEGVFRTPCDEQLLVQNLSSDVGDYSFHGT